MKKYIPYISLVPKIYREEAVGLKSSKYTLKIDILWVCEIWGNFLKNWYFVNSCLM